MLHVWHRVDSKRLKAELNTLLSCTELSYQCVSSGVSTVLPAGVSVSVLGDTFVKWIPVAPLQPFTTTSGGGKATVRLCEAPEQFVLTDQLRDITSSPSPSKVCL